MGARVLVAAFVAYWLVACRPDIDEPASRIDVPRVLAVVMEPPEASPGDMVNAHALVASAEGTVTDASLDWALCHDPKSPAEDRTVNPACLGDAESVGSGVAAGFRVPGDACALFGPDTPPGDFRPRDPDSTGGFFQPLRVRLGEDDSVALERLRCDLGNAAVDVATRFVHEYSPNQNPKVRAVTATVRGAAANLDHIAPRTAVRFELSWTAGDAESFLRFDPGPQSLVVDEEVLRVSWYASAGSFEADRTGRTDGASFSSNVWSAPSRASTHTHFWAVLRDSRGGQDFAAWDAVVTVE